MRIAVLHDYFVQYGGGERLVITMAKALNAEIYTGFVDGKKTFPFDGIKVNTLMDLPKQTKGLTTLKLLYKFYRLRLNHDVVIYSGTSSIMHKSNCPSIWYCHTPARHLYSQKDWFTKKLKGIKKIGLNLFFNVLKLFDKKAVKNIDEIIVNSQNVGNRVSKYYRRDYEIIYPPIETDKFRWTHQGDYYLSYGRLDELKRIETIVSAFTEMPNKKLIVSSGGVLLNKIRRMAKDHNNIEVTGFVEDDKLKELVGGCIATIYIPIDEDFGMTPVESQSAGKPCIGVKEGGLLETINHKINGYLCDKQVNKYDIIDAVDYMNKEVSLDMKIDCIENSKKFDESIFIEKIKNKVYGVL